jgi:hypothetical protein
MFVERRVNPSTGVVELWRADWVNQPGAKAHKIYISKICDEETVSVKDGDHSEVSAICWAYGRSLGNIAVQSKALVGLFPGQAGDDAQLPCRLVYAGKFRNGVDRWWCQTHQTHWGIKGDQQSFAATGEMRCSNHAQPLSYVVGPQTIDLEKYAEVGIWCSMPAAIATTAIAPRHPRLHVHARTEVGAAKALDGDFAAVSIQYDAGMDLFGSKEINRVDITPPAAFEFVCGLESKREMSCVNCTHCGYPHLDLGDFAKKPHRKHFCGNCGRDSTMSKSAIISTPLRPLHDLYAKSVTYEVPDRELDLDKFAHCSYAIWASTPAIIWKSDRAQEFGIHVRVCEGTQRIIDDTFGAVILHGKALNRDALVKLMIDRSVI